METSSATGNLPRDVYRRPADSDWRLSTAPVTESARETGETLLIKRWDYLCPRDVIELRRGTDLLGTGQVDEAIPDGSAVWIHLARGLGRVLIHRGDGISIWRRDQRGALTNPHHSDPGQPIRLPGTVARVPQGSA